ncbi:hypothetical protein PI95_017830 [Hassallia byssoidea VB512170]|uniref:Uncharacterized protein n=1 Tax=Hassallia byssoidea VB512170 TaxID=1304833 RepID=A0A846HC48_9CYAN|nr:hypothetical protein [Hassalia byssoidea]NEU74369.1 hypothetical protein [Hassalia byssoidea VB512170]
MNSPKFRQKILLAIITVNIISTWLHYIDNALFLNQYSGFEWFTPAGVIGTVIVMTPLGLLGYWLYTKGMFRLTYLTLGLYSITSISSPGHYLLPIIAPMSLKMHSLIWLDGVAGLTLISFLVWSSVILQEWRIIPTAN